MSKAGQRYESGRYDRGVRLTVAQKRSKCTGQRNFGPLQGSCGRLAELLQLGVDMLIGGELDQVEVLCWQGQTDVREGIGNRTVCAGDVSDVGHEYRDELQVANFMRRVTRC